MASYQYTFNSGDGVTPTRLNAARTVSEIVNADVSASAAIAGTKIAPNFGSQDITVAGRACIIQNSSNFALAFGTNSTERLRISDGGNVGIATASPSATLHVLRGTANGGTAQFNGTQQTSHFAYSTDEHTYIRGGKTASNVYIADMNTGDVILGGGGGRVGVNTSSPGYLLDVNGIVNTTASFRVDGVVVVGARQTGWTAPTGTFNRGTFNSDTVTLPQLAARVHALIDDLAAHGLIDS